MSETSLVSTKHQRKAGDSVLPLAAIGASLVAMSSNFFFEVNIAGIIISIVGLAAGIAYFTGKTKWFFLLIQIWIYGQFPSISRETITSTPDGSTYSVETPILDAGQVFKYGVGMGLNGSNGKLNLYLNLIPFAWLMVFRLLQSRALVGCVVTIKQFRKDNKLGDVFPLTGTVRRVATLGSEKHWLLIELDKALNYSGNPSSHLLIRDKEGEIFKPGKAGRVSYLVLAPDPELIHDGSNRKDQFQFADWGLVSLKR